MRYEKKPRLLPLNGKAWRMLREAVLSRDPLCRCGCGKPSTDVDHIDEDASNNDMDNLMGLAHECHSIKTQTGKLPTGYDENGLPLTGPWAQMLDNLKNRQQPRATSRVVPLVSSQTD